MDIYQKKENKGGFMDYKQFLQQQAILKAYKNKLLKACPTLTENSGIYILTRTDEDGIEYCYVGQAKHILTRLAQHMKGYPQHIDASLKKRGLYSKDNPYGWGIDFYECAESELDAYEKYEILQHKNVQLYNVTGGSQSAGKRNLVEGKTPKGYYDGIKQGYAKARKELAKLFEKNLMVIMQGKPNKLKEKALNKFNAFMKGE